MAAVLLAVAAAAPAAATNPPGAPFSPVSSAPTAAAAGSVTVAVPLYPLVCGRPTGSLSVEFPPSRVHLPRAIAPGAVTLNGAAVATIRVSGRTVSITLQPPKGATCHSIAAGKLQIAFAASSQVRLTHGATVATVRHARQLFHARVVVS